MNQKKLNQIFQIKLFKYNDGINFVILNNFKI